MIISNQNIESLKPVIEGGLNTSFTILGIPFAGIRTFLGCRRIKRCYIAGDGD